MAGSTRYTISAFIEDAKAILANGAELDEQKAEIGERLSVLSRRDDLTRFGIPLGPADGSNENYILYREPPYTSLLLAQFDPGYNSPVHEHGEFWVIGCGYRGRDRWDMYERTDDGSQPGYATLELVDRYDIPPGRSVFMPKPPRAIHGHNNLHDGLTLELIFTAAKPSDPADRLIYYPEENLCFPSPWAPASVLVGDRYPPLPQSGASRLGQAFGRLARRALCPLCAALAPRPACVAA